MTSIRSVDTLRGSNWGGSIPVIVTLAPTSLSSPTLPAPVHLLLSRQTFLHVGMQSAVLRLHKFAPTTLSFANGMVQNEPDPGSFDDSEHHNDRDELESKPYPVCWFEDEVTQIALRWHLFAGVLFDMKRDRQLPWRIRLHFTAYPSSQILSLERPVLLQVQQGYKNSLKQALCLEYGNSKTAMGVTKDSHGRLWHAVSTGNYALYNQVNADLQHSDIMLLPVRLYVNARPPIQRKCLPTGTLGSLLVDWLPEAFFSGNDTWLASDSVVSWRIGGIQPALDTPLRELWLYLCHPDHFLYITILIN